jgi:hypothetical protein
MACDCSRQNMAIVWVWQLQARYQRSPCIFMNLPIWNCLTHAVTANIEFPDKVWPLTLQRPRPLSFNQGGPFSSKKSRCGQAHLSVGHCNRIENARVQQGRVSGVASHQ